MIAAHDSDAPLEARLLRHGEAVSGVIVRAQAIPAGATDRPRAPGKWTPVQEVVHLALTYREFSAVFGGAPEFTLLVPPEKAAQYRHAVLPRILAGGWFPSGAAAPDRVQAAGEAETMAAALTQLRIAADEFHAAVRGAGRAHAGRAWNHPYFGPMALLDLLDLLSEHANHHARLLGSAP